MRAPRRTPYENPGALKHLYTLLYPEDQCDIINDESYRMKRRDGLSIVHLWLNRSACPHAVESTASLIHAQQLDEQLLLFSSLPSTSYGSEWAIRCAYSTAILRFVNSIVDTFQTAMFAKSIFHISKRIGLPAYLVELRHAATHEELPSLVVLRDACRESLLWLQRSFWWPTLTKQQSFSSKQIHHTATNSSAPLKIDLEPLQKEAETQLRVNLARYRKIAKRVVKDDSLRGRYRTALAAAQSKVESCAKRYEASAVQSRGFAEQGEDWEEEQMEGSAAALLVDALLEPGGLIALSKRKRPRGGINHGNEIAKLPIPLLRTWLPLLNHLSASIDGFATALQESLVGSLTPSSAAVGRSYLDTAASWIIALFGEDKHVLSPQKLPTKTLQFSSDMSEDEGESEQDKPTLVLARRCLTAPSEMSLAVARLLCANDEQLSDRIKPLLEMAEVPLLDVEAASHLMRSNIGQEIVARENEAASELEMSVLEMEQKLQALQETAVTSQEKSLPGLIKEMTKQDHSQVNVCKQLPGWQCAPSDWTPTPFGCLNGQVPQLALSDVNDLS